MLATRTRVGLAGLTTEVMAASQDITRLTPNDEVDADFLCRHLLREAGTLQRKSRGTTIQGITKNELQSMSLPLPPLPEQRAIANILDSIDQAIEATDALVSATEQLRDSLLHNLLTRGLPGHHTQWKEVPGLGTIPTDWEVRAIGNLANVKGGKRLPKGSSFATSNTGLPYIRVVDFRDRSVSLNDIQFLDPHIQESIKRYTISERDVYISIAGTIGLVGIVPAELDGANLTENAAKIVITNPAEISQQFLSSFLDSAAGRSQITTRINALGQPKLALERIRTIEVSLPSILEQQAISTILESVDESLEEGRRAREGLRKLKESASDALLTGRVRVKEAMKAYYE